MEGVTTLDTPINPVNDDVIVVFVHEHRLWLDAWREDLFDRAPYQIIVPGRRCCSDGGGFDSHCKRILVKMMVSV